MIINRQCQLDLSDVLGMCSAKLPILMYLAAALLLTKLGTDAPDSLCKRYHIIQHIVHIDIDEDCVCKLILITAHKSRIF